jgi:hypothetical protein
MARPARRQAAAMIAARIAEDMRALNHATLPHDGFPGLAGPADAHNTIGALETAIARMPQALGQIRAFLLTQDRVPRLADDFSRFAGQPHAAIAHTVALLGQAGACLRPVEHALDRAHNATAGLYIAGPDDAR